MPANPQDPAQIFDDDITKKPAERGEPGEWPRILNGEARPAVADALLAHAAVCRDCAARLRMLSKDASPEETAEVGNLASISREWQHKLAVELARTPHRQTGKRAARLYLWV